MRSLLVFVISLALSSTGCLGPVSLHKAVLEYDKTVQHLESQMLLLNIARLRHNLPDHYTVTSAIAATFDYRTNVGFQGEFPGFSNNKDKLLLNFGVEASENPTLSIVPVQGEQFTRRILHPLEDEILAFLSFQGAPFDLMTRLMARGIEVQNPNGTFSRFILNDPNREDEYREFRQIVIHLESLGRNRQLFVGPIEFDEKIPISLLGKLSGEDIASTLEKGYRLQLNEANEYELIRRVVGRVAVTNYDLGTLNDAERSKLNDRAVKRPKNFVLVDIRQDGPGSDYPIFQDFKLAFKLRSLNAILAFLANTIDEDHHEYDIPPLDPKDLENCDLRQIECNPKRTLAIQETEIVPATTLRVKFAGQYYSVPNTNWDRYAFLILYKLFQMTVTDVSAVGVPITISK